jgi:hypothetical protein
MLDHPFAYPELGITIAWGGVNMIDAILIEQIQDLSSLSCTGIFDGKGTKDRACAVMTSLTKRQGGYLWHTLSFIVI